MVFFFLKNLNFRLPRFSHRPVPIFTRVMIFYFNFFFSGDVSSFTRAIPSVRTVLNILQQLYTTPLL